MAVRNTYAQDDAEEDMAPHVSETHAEWLERIKRIPGVIVHQRDPDYVVGTYKPTIKLAKPLDVLFLLGRRNEDGSRRLDRA